LFASPLESPGDWTRILQLIIVAHLNDFAGGPAGHEASAGLQDELGAFEEISKL
jgi:hypothetical protein